MVFPSATPQGEEDDPQPAGVSEIWVALTTAAVAALTLATAMTTPPRSGPYCQRACITYPYTDAQAYVPRDYLWMYPAVLLAVLVVVLAASIANRVRLVHPVLERVATSCVVIGAGALLVDYAIQLTVLQPALLRGETEGLSPWSQYNPYGVFIALETVGYTMIDVGFGVFGLALIRRSMRLQRGAGWVFLSGGVLTCALLVGYAAFYGSRLDYRFEVLSILITGLVLIIAPTMLGVALTRARPNSRIDPGPASGSQRAEPGARISNRTVGSGGAG